MQQFKGVPIYITLYQNEIMSFASDREFNGQFDILDPYER